MTSDEHGVFGTGTWGEIRGPGLHSWGFEERVPELSFTRVDRAKRGELVASRCALNTWCKAAGGRAESLWLQGPGVGPQMLKSAWRLSRKRPHFLGTRVETVTLHGREFSLKGD